LHKIKLWNTHQAGEIIYGQVDNLADLAGKQLLLDDLLLGLIIDRGCEYNEDYERFVVPLLLKSNPKYAEKGFGQQLVI